MACSECSSSFSIFVGSRGTPGRSRNRPLHLAHDICPAGSDFILVESFADHDEDLLTPLDRFHLDGAVRRVEFDPGAVLERHESLDSEDVSERTVGKEVPDPAGQILFGRPCLENVDRVIVIFPVKGELYVVFEDVSAGGDGGEVVVSEVVPVLLENVAAGIRERVSFIGNFGWIPGQ